MNRKPVFKIAVGIVIFCLLVATTAPAITICDSICCSDLQKSEPSGCLESRLSLDQVMNHMGVPHRPDPVDGQFPTQSLLRPIPTCHDEATHSCCEVETPLAADKRHAIALITSQNSHYQLLTILAFSEERSPVLNQSRLYTSSYLSAARAAPVQIYLQNLSILC